MNNEVLRKLCRELKCFQKITYKEIASYIDIKLGSFYAWLNGYYDLGGERQQQLYDVIRNLKE